MEHLGPAPTVDCGKTQVNHVVAREYGPQNSHFSFRQTVFVSLCASPQCLKELNAEQNVVGANCWEKIVCRVCKQLVWLPKCTPKVPQNSEGNPGPSLEDRLF